MKRPPSPVEFTPAGQAKNSSASITQTLATATGPDVELKPYLGSLAVVQDLVRVFLSEELTRLSATSQGTLAPDAAVAQSEAAVQRMTKIFTGADARYTAMPGWHQPGALPAPGLADTIRQRLAEHAPAAAMATPEKAGQTLFVLALLELRGAVTSYGQTNNAEQLRETAMELADNYSRILLGLPAHDDPESETLAAAAS